MNTVAQQALEVAVEAAVRGDIGVLEGLPDAVLRTARTAANTYVDEFGRDVRGDLLIHRCVRQSAPLAVVRYLCETRSVSPHELSGFGGTALHAAAFHGRLELARYFCLELRMDARKPVLSGISPAVLAAMNGHAAVLRLFAHECAVPLAAPSDDGAACLWAAAAGGHADVVELLIGEVGVALTFTNDSGHSPLSIASALRHVDIVHALLDAGGGAHTGLVDAHVRLLAECLAEGAARGRALRTLDLSHNALAGRTARALAACIAGMAFLERIDLAHNRVDAAALRQLLTALPAGITALDISYNEADGSVLSSLALVLPAHARMRELGVAGATWNAAQFAEFAHALRHTRLARLDLSSGLAPELADACVLAHGALAATHITDLRVRLPDEPGALVAPVRAALDCVLHWNRASLAALWSFERHSHYPFAMRQRVRTLLVLARSSHPRTVASALGWAAMPLELFCEVVRHIAAGFFCQVAE